MSNGDKGILMSHYFFQYSAVLLSLDIMVTYNSTNVQMKSFLCKPEAYCDTLLFAFIFVTSVLQVNL